MRAVSGPGDASRPPASVRGPQAPGHRGVTAGRRGARTRPVRADRPGAAPVTVTSVLQVVVPALRGRSVRAPARAMPEVPVRLVARANGTAVPTVGPASARGPLVVTQGRPAPAAMTVRSVHPVPGPGPTGRARAGDRASRAAVPTARRRVTVNPSGRAVPVPGPRVGATAGTSARATSRLVDRSAGRRTVRRTERVLVSAPIAVRTGRTASVPPSGVLVGTVTAGRAGRRGSARPALARTARVLVPVRRAAEASRRATPPTARTTVPRGPRATGPARRVRAPATGHGRATVRGSRTAGARASAGGPAIADSDLRASGRSRRARSARRTASGRPVLSGPRTGRVPSAVGGSRTGPGVPIAGVQERTGRRVRRPTGRPGRPACGPTVSVVTVRGALAGSGPVPPARGVAGTSRRAGSGTTTVGRPVRRSRTGFPRPSCRRTSPSRTSTVPSARGCAR